MGFWGFGVLREKRSEEIFDIVLATFSFGVSVASALAEGKENPPKAVFSVVESGIQFIKSVEDAVSKYENAHTEGKRIRYLMGEFERVNQIVIKFNKSRTAKQDKLSQAYKFLTDVKSNNFNEETATSFLERFGTIGIIISSIDINELGITMDNIVKGLCSIITTTVSGSSLPTIDIEAVDILCAETRKTVASIIKIMESTNDNGKTLSQILVELATLKLEESSAARLSKTLENSLQSLICK